MGWFYIALLLVYLVFFAFSIYKIRLYKFMDNPDKEESIFYNKMLLTSSIIAVIIPVLSFGLVGEFLVHAAWSLGLGKELFDGAYITGLFASFNAALLWPLALPFGTLLLIFAAKNEWKILRTLAIPIMIIIWGFCTIFIVI